MTRDRSCAARHNDACQNEADPDSSESRRRQGTLTARDASVIARSAGRLAPACHRQASLYGGWPLRKSLFGCMAGGKQGVAGMMESRSPESGHARSAHAEEENKEGRSPRCLHQPPLGHRQDRIARHDQVIQHAHVDQCRRRFQCLRQMLIRPRRLRRSAGMVVHE